MAMSTDPFRFQTRLVRRMRSPGCRNCCHATSSGDSSSSSAIS